MTFLICCSLEVEGGAAPSDIEWFYRLCCVPIVTDEAKGLMFVVNLLSLLLERGAMCPATTTDVRFN
jgi:hypothetical protein